jgi:hypothetical protein
MLGAEWFLETFRVLISELKDKQKQAVPRSDKFSASVQEQP